MSQGVFCRDNNLTIVSLFNPSPTHFWESSSPQSFCFPAYAPHPSIQPEWSEKKRERENSTRFYRVSPRVIAGCCHRKWGERGARGRNFAVAERANERENQGDRVVVVVVTGMVEEGGGAATCWQTDVLASYVYLLTPSSSPPIPPFTSQLVAGSALVFFSLSQCYFFFFCLSRIHTFFPTGFFFLIGLT